MKAFHIGIFSALLVLLVSCCTIGSDRQLDYGGGAKQVPTLEVPPDLTAPAGDDRYKVPGDGGAVATYSDYSKGGTAQGRGISLCFARLHSYLPSVHASCTGQG